MEILKKNYKRYLWSSLVTFLAVFLPIVATDLSHLDLEVAGFTAIGITFARAGVKALVESFKPYERK